MVVMTSYTPGGQLLYPARTCGHCRCHIASSLPVCYHTPARK